MPGTSLNSFSQLRWPSFSNRIPHCLCTRWLMTFPYRRHINVFIKCPPFTHRATKFRIYCSFYSVAYNKYQVCSFPYSFSPPQIFQALHHHRPTYKVPILGKLLGKHLQLFPSLELFKPQVRLHLATESQKGWGWKAPLEIIQPSHPAQSRVTYSRLLGSASS